jgi:hypothetical protein
MAYYPEAANRAAMSPQVYDQLSRLERQLKVLRASAVKVLGACDKPEALAVALDELERVVRATPLT